MITQPEQRTIERYGEFTENQFTIKATAKSFRLLISNLYSNKTLSLQKELAQNARDSHIAAGKKDIPFEIYLPTPWECNYIINDFGTGIEHSYMMNEYTKIFHSSKDKNNEFVGSLGCGRVAALSVSDSYLCESRINGIKRIYSVFISEQGIPTCAFLGEEKTDEENGFLVNIPVDPALCNDFEKNGREAYRYFNPKPIIKNRDDFKINENTYIVASEDGSFGLRGSSETSVGIMGSYAYSLDIDSITDLTDLQKSVLLSGLVVEFNIGDLDVAVSRESLHYDKRTIENIKKKIDSIIPFIEPAILAQFQNKNTFQKMEILHDILGYNGRLASISDLTKELIRKMDIPNNIRMDDFEVTEFSYDNYRQKIKKSTITTLIYKKDTVWLYADKKSHLKLKAKKYFEDAANEHKRLVFFYAKTKTAINDFKIKWSIDIAAFPKASAMPFDPVTRTGKTLKIRTLIYMGDRWTLKDCWKDGDADVNAELIYVKRNGYTLESDHSRRSRDTKYFGEKVKHLEKLTGKTYTVFGLTQRQINKKGDKWIEFKTVYDQALKEYLVKQESNVAAARYYQHNYSEFDESLIKKLQVDKNSLCYKIYQEYKELEKIAEEIDLNLFENKKVSATVNYKYSQKLLEEKYPLLAAVNEYHLTKDAIQDLTEYVNNKAITDA